MHHFFFKLERILRLMIRKAKGVELMKIVFQTHLNTFMDFENVTLTKVVHIYGIEGMNT
jgi:hypothetical protein